MDSPSILVFHVCGTSELVRSIEWRGISLQDLTSNLVTKHILKFLSAHKVMKQFVSSWHFLDGYLKKKLTVVHLMVQQFIKHEVFVRQLQNNAWFQRPCRAQLRRNWTFGDLQDAWLQHEHQGAISAYLFF